MRLSARDSREWKTEFKTISDQRHIDQVWSVMKPRVNEYANRYFADRMHEGGLIQPEQAVVLHVKKLIMANDDYQETYRELFDPDLMEEYGEDTEGFKSVVLKKKCPVIVRTLGSPVDDLKEWKSKFYGCKSQRIYDAFLNMMEFAADYDSKMDEEAMRALNQVRDCRLSEMEDDESEFGNCYLTGVLGYGIVANILGHMYPRTFPGSHRAGTWSLYFFTKGDKTIFMPSGTSEFIMLKDDYKPRPGSNFSTDHNFFLPYEVFCIYALRIYRLLVARMKERYGYDFPSESRFLLTNDFFEFVRDENSDSIATFTGSDIIPET